MSRIHAALLGGAMGLTSMSCVNRESPPLDHEGTVASHEEPLSGQGMEALIPLRLVNVLPCAPGPSCPDNADYHSVLRSVDAANEVFKAVGVQFWKLANARHPGYDAIAPDGRRIQIKTRCVLPDAKLSQRLGCIKLTYEWDTVILILINGDFEPLAIYEALRSDIERELKKPGSKARNERGALGVKKFISIARPTWKREDE